MEKFFLLIGEILNPRPLSALIWSDLPRNSPSLRVHYASKDWIDIEKKCLYFLSKPTYLGISGYRKFEADFNEQHFLVAFSTIEFRLPNKPGGFHEEGGAKEARGLVKEGGKGR
ncbi:hypothetical protein HAX54_008753 [Datura stramonium]|uniref:Uncharacterized protein n=1 Tax=Datura stramonium TaxID=4076 RepID=A0ABS8TF77_DATST|nr:hypothetical protein [Datura stramonium]